METYIFNHAGRLYEVKANTEDYARKDLLEHLLRRDGIFATMFPLHLVAIYAG